MAVILIVEDEVFTRTFAELIIKDWGHETLIAGDADEALILLRSPDRIDALFTDVYLKTDIHGGCELARLALEMRPDLRVLYTTGNSATNKMKALFAEGTHFLSKPYTPEQLHLSVDNLLAA